MVAGYAFAFCRWVIGIAFAWSFWGKVRDVSSFVAAIERFRLLPGWLHKPAAWAFLAGELGVTLTMLPGGVFALWGFLLAALMLLVFCVALASVLLRKINTSCNCFGASEKAISPYDLLRNAGFIACALAGLTLTFATPPPLGWLESGLMFAVALVFVAVWAQAGEIVTLFT